MRVIRRPSFTETLSLSPWPRVQAIRSVLEEWCGQPLELSAFYGVRTYRNGSVLK